MKSDPVGRQVFRWLRGLIVQAARLIDRWNWVFIAAVALFLLFPSPRNILAALVIPLLWMVSWVASGEPLPRTPLNGILLLLFSMLLVSLYATYDIALSLPKITGMLLGLAVFFSIVGGSRLPGGWRFGFIVFLAMGLGVAVLGLLGTSWALSKFAFINPITSRIPGLISGLQGAEGGFHPNEVAGALLWVLPVLITTGFSVIFSGKGSNKSKPWLLWLYRLFLWSSGVFIAGVFMLTQSRSAYIGLGLTLPLMLLFAVPAEKRKYLVIGLLLLLLVLGLYLAQEGNLQRLRSLFLDSGLVYGSGFSINSIQGRLEIWSRAIYGIQDFPFTGMGMNTFREVVHVLYPLFSVSSDSDIGHAHNEFLQVGLDLGIPGLVAFAALYIGSFWMLIQTWRISRDQGFSLPNFGCLTMRPLVLGLSGGLLAHFFYGLTDAIALGAKPGIILWALFGLITGLFLQVRGFDQHSKFVRLGDHD